MNKKAQDMVLSETVRIYIAIACIVLLLILAFAFYGIFTKKTAKEQAKSELDQIMGFVGLLKEGESHEFLIENPKDWIFFYDNVNKQLCICIESTIGSLPDCKKSGECRQAEITPFNMIQIKNPFKINISRQNNTISISKK
jgi:hypothetical protein